MKKSNVGLKIENIEIYLVQKLVKNMKWNRQNKKRKIKRTDKTKNEK